MVILSVARGPDEGEVYKLSNEQTHVIGRRNGEVPLNDTRVSKRHAELRFADGAWLLSDLGSSNGTYLNRKLVRKATPLKDGDRIRLGRTKLLFTTAEAAARRMQDDDAFDVSDLAQIDPADDDDEDALEPAPAMTLADDDDDDDEAPARPAPPLSPARTAADDAIQQTLLAIQEKLDGLAGAGHSEDDILHDILEAVRSRDDAPAPAGGEIDIDAIVQRVSEAVAARHDEGGDEAREDALAAIAQRLDEVMERLNAADDAAAPDGGAAPDADTVEPGAIEQVRQRIEQLNDKLDQIAAATRGEDDVLQRIEQQVQAAKRDAGDSPSADALASIEARMQELAERIDRLAEQPRGDDRIDQVLQSVQTRPRAVAPRTLKRIREKLDELTSADRDEQLVQRMREAVAPPQDDDTPQKLAAILAAIEALRDQPAQHTQVTEAIEALRESVQQPTPPPAELSAKLDAILDSLQQQQSAAATEPAADPRLEQLHQDVLEALDARAEPDPMVTEALAKILEAVAPKQDDPTRMLLDSVLARLEQLSSPQRQAELVEAIRQGVQGVEQDHAQRIEQALSQLQQKLDATPDTQLDDLLLEALEKLDTLASPQREQQMLDAVRQAVQGDGSAQPQVAQLSQQIEALRQAIEQKPAGDPLIADALAKLMERVEQAPTRDEQKQWLNAVREAVDQQAELSSELQSAPPVDTAPIERELAELRAAVHAHRPADELRPMLEQLIDRAPAQPDGRVVELLESVLEVVTAPDEQNDLAKELAELRQQLEALAARDRDDDRLDKIAAAVAVNPNEQVQEQLDHVLEAIEKLASRQEQAQLNSVAPAEPDTSRLEAQLQAMRETLAQRPADEALNHRLDQLEAKLADLSDDSRVAALIEQMREQIDSRSAQRVAAMREQIIAAVQETSSQPQLQQQMSAVIAALRFQQKMQKQMMEALRQMAAGGVVANAAAVDDAPPYEHDEPMYSPAPAPMPTPMPVSSLRSDDDRTWLEDDVAPLGVGADVVAHDVAMAADDRDTVLASRAPTAARYDDTTDKRRGAVGRFAARVRQQPLGYALGAIGIAALIFIVADVLTNTLSVTDPSLRQSPEDVQANVAGRSSPGNAAGTPPADTDAGANPPPPDANDPSIAAQRIAQQEAAAASQVQQALTQITGADGGPSDDGSQKPPVDLSQMKKVALLVDLSGASSQALPQVLEAAMQPLSKLDASQQVTVVMFEGDTVYEAPPVGWKPATARTRQQIERWMQATAQSVTPAPTASPVKAIVQTTPYSPDLIWLFSADIAGDRPGQVRRDDLLQTLDIVNTDRTIRINTTQLLRPDPSNTLKIIAEQHNGTYTLIESDAGSADGAAADGPANADNPPIGFAPDTWAAPADADDPPMSVSQLQTLVHTLSSQRGAEHAQTLEARRQLALAMAHEGRLPQAEALLSNVLQTTRRARGQTHAQTLTMMSSLAALLSQGGKHAEAEPHLRQVLAVQRRELGDDAPPTLASMAALADTVAAQGRLPEAQSLRQAALAATIRRHGEAHPQTVLAREGLAAVTEARDQLKETERLRRQSLDTWRDLFGDTAPGTLDRTVTLAHLLRDKIGKRQEADDLLAGVARRLHLADDITDAGAVQQSALALAAAGQHRQSELLHRRAIDLSRRALGDEHRLTLQWRSALAAPLMRQERYDDAKATLDATLADQQRLLGPSDPHTLTTLTRLAQLHRRQDRFDQAAELLSRVADARRGVLGADHEDTIAVTVELAEALELAGRKAHALAVHEAVLEARASRFGTRDQRTLLSLNTVARLLREVNRLDDAEAVQLRAVQASIDLLGEDNTATLAAMHALALLHHLQGKWTEAEATYRRELALREPAQGPRHRDTLAALTGLAMVLKHQEAHQRAAPLWSRLLDVQRQTLGEDHADTLATLHEFAMALAAAGDPAEAENLLRQELDLRTQSAGVHDLPTIRATHQLALLLERNGKRDAAVAALRNAVAGYASLANAAPPLNPAVLAMLREGAEACTRMLGEDDSDTRRCQTLLNQAAASRNG